MRSKTEAREALQARFADVSHREYERLAARAYVNASQLMASVLQSTAPPSVLLYEANPHWREVQLSGLEAEYPHVSFDYAATARDAPLPTGVYDYIFVPLYGYTSNGYRLGHGAGWYDRLLASQPRALKIGVGIRHGLIDFPVEPHDIPMNVVVTDEKVIMLPAVDMREK